MAELEVPVLTLGVCAPLIGALYAMLSSSESSLRRMAAALALLSTLCSLEALREVLASGGVALHEGWAVALLGVSHPLFRADQLNTVTMSLFSAITLGTLVLAPRRDCGRGSIAGLLLLLSATLATFASDSLLVLVAGWALGLLPFFVRRLRTDGTVSRSAQAVLLLSLALLVAGVVLIGIEDVRDKLPVLFVFSADRTQDEVGPIHWLLLGAAVMRTGLFPFHWWAVSLFAKGPLLAASMAANAQLGVFLVARMAVSMFPDADRELLPIVSNLGLFTGVFTAVLGVVERNPRRLIALLMTSQFAVLFAAMTTASVEAISGALVHWFVIAVATTGLVGVYRAVEARVGGEVDADLGTDRYLGLVTHFPRLAVFFAISGLALVGLPGTLGFCSEDLLLHGSLQADPFVGIAMPLAAALNAIQVFRLFSHLFLGRVAAIGQGVPDALPRERWVLSIALLFLVFGGLAPSVLVKLQTPAAQEIAGAEGPHQHP